MLLIAAPSRRGVRAFRRRDEIAWNAEMTEDGVHIFISGSRVARCIGLARFVHRVAR